MLRRFPRQIKYIVGNEAAERYSFYGMKGILALFMTQTLLFSDQHAESVFHLFVFGVYFAPILGAYLSDRFWGKYRTMMTLSLVYVAGHATLALWIGETGLYVGLALVAIGAGGIKPCASALVGDQFTRANKELLPAVFNLFYFSINFGSFFATIITPWTRRAFGPELAFGIPGILMAIAVLILWLGRRYYVMVPPTGKRDDTPGKVMLFMLVRGVKRARLRFGDQPVEDTLAVLRVGRVFIPVIMYWALYDQTGSSWVLLTRDMNLHGFLEPDMLQSANPAMIMLMIPLFTALVYPWFARSAGAPVRALSKMRVGMFTIGVAFVAVAIIQELITRGYYLSAFWMLVPYLLLTISEVLVSITGLEFAYTQAPRAVKSTVMGMFYLTISFGNLIAAFVAGANFLDGTSKFLFWAAAVGVLGLVFIALTRNYRVAEYLEE